MLRYLFKSKPDQPEYDLIAMYFHQVLLFHADTLCFGNLPADTPFISSNSDHLVYTEEETELLNRTDELRKTFNDISNIGKPFYSTHEDIEIPVFIKFDNEWRECTKIDFHLFFEQFGAFLRTYDSIHKQLFEFNYENTAYVMNAKINYSDGTVFINIISLKEK
jgi:hypothetical protein